MNFISTGVYNKMKTGVVHFAKKYYSRIIFDGLCILIALISITSYSISYEEKVKQISMKDGNQSILARIVGYPNFSDNGISVCTRVISKSTGIKDGVGLYVTIKNCPKNVLGPGDIIRFKSELVTYTNASNEGGFSFASYLKEKNMHGGCRVDFDKLSVIRVNGTKEKRIYDIRCRFASVCDKYLANSEISGLVKAVISGDRSGLKDSVGDAFKKCGIYHIVAISGLHLSIIVSVLISLFSKSKLKNAKKDIITYSFVIAASLFILVFTGYGVSVIRAVFMIVILTICVVFLRSYSGKNALFLAAIFIAAFYPQDLFGVSFYLSFLSTLAVMFSADILSLIKKSKKLKKLSKIPLLPVFVTSTLSTLFTLPITAFSFGYIPLYSFIANAVVLPIVPFLIGTSVIFSISCIFPFKLLTLILSCAINFFAFFIIKSAQIISALPHSTLNAIPDIIASLCVIVFTPLFCILIFKKYGIKKSISAMMIFTIAEFCFLGYNNQKGNLRVTYIDVGQGDCTIITMPNGETAIIDCGTQFSSSIKYVLSNVKAYLRLNGITSISAAYVSHFHSDHTNGLYNLIYEGYIKSLVIPKYSDSSEYEAKQIRHDLLVCATKANIPVYYISDKTKITYKNGVNFDIYFPSKTAVFDNNNMSAVFKITYGETKFLFCGDSEDKEQKRLLEKNIKCDVLKMPHHGGYSSTTKSFVKMCAPKYAIVSCGKNNMYKHPSRKTLNILADNNVKIIRTDKNGAISFYADKSGVKKITCMLK